MTKPVEPEPKVMEEIAKAMRKISHGHVLIVIHDSKVVQIETLEKKRLERQ
jgi:hypothetical protein